MKTVNDHVSLDAARARVQGTLQPQGRLLHVTPSGVPEVLDSGFFADVIHTRPGESLVDTVRTARRAPRYEPQDSEGGEL